MNKLLTTTLACAFSGAALAATEPCLMQIRLRGLHTANDEQWGKTFAALRENRGACDEVWFSTGIGFPKMAWHRDHVKRLQRYAAQLREVGIVPSLQFQATLGHGDDETTLEGADGKTWGGFTGRGGTECLYCNCPRQPAFLAYMREMAEIYATLNLGAVWIDDDLRVAGHAPGAPWSKAGQKWIGCWCPTCLAAFNAETGAKWTREALDKAMRKDSALFDRWEKFSFDSLVEVARVIAEATHRVCPTTMLAYQHGAYRNKSQLAIFKAMADATHLKVGSRAGGGAYFDYDPNSQCIKAFDAAQQRVMLDNADCIGVWCPEIETFPRAFASRTTQGILNECLVNLAIGMNAISLLIMDTRYETDAWYAENLLAPLAAERKLLEDYRALNAGTQVAGLGDRSKAKSWDVYRFALTGVPVVPGVGRAYGTLTADDLKGFKISEQCSSGLLALRHKMDERAGGQMPVVVEDPSVALVIPRVKADGTLRTVMMMNCRIDTQKPVRLRLRGVPHDAAFAEWRAFHNAPTRLPLVRQGSDALVTLPAIAAWNAGYLIF